jgi:hypothetical protein
LPHVSRVQSSTAVSVSTVRSGAFHRTHHTRRSMRSSKLPELRNAPLCLVLSSSSATCHISGHRTMNSVKPSSNARPSDVPVQPSNCVAPKVSHRTRPMTPEPTSSAVSDGPFASETSPLAQWKIGISLPQKCRIPPRKLGGRETGPQTHLYHSISTAFANVLTTPSVHHHVQVS